MIERLSALSTDSGENSQKNWLTRIQAGKTRTDFGGHSGSDSADNYPILGLSLSTLSAFPYIVNLGLNNIYRLDAKASSLPVISIYRENADNADNGMCGKPHPTLVVSGRNNPKSTKRRDS